MSFSDQNYFKLFSLPESFPLDNETLLQNYLVLQEQTHPDRFVAASAEQRLQAMQSSSVVNEAYETLKSPLRRAAYLLGLRGVDVNKVIQAELSQELLLEQIALREALESLPRDDASLGELEKLRSKVEARLSSGILKFTQLIEKSEHLAAKKIYHEMQYFHKLLSEVKTLEEDLLGY